MLTAAGTMAVTQRPTPIPLLGGDPDELLSVARAAKIAGLSQATMRRWLTLKTLARYKIGSRTFIKRGDLQKLVRKV